MDGLNDKLAGRGTVLHWYDFICPFCYIGQNRTAILARDDFNVVELPFQAHPEIPRGGIAAGLRTGPMYAALEREARSAAMPLDWPPHLPDSRPALAAAEWVRSSQPDRFTAFRQGLFAAHFALREDIEDPAVIGRHAEAAGIDEAAMRVALADGSAFASVAKAERRGRQYGVRGTPAWLLNDRLITGLLATDEFEGLVAAAPRSSECRGVTVMDPQ